MNPIIFCKKKSLEITSTILIKNILNTISKYNKKNSNGFLLFLTIYNNKKYCIFINKETEQFIYVRFCFKDHLFSDTLFEGKLIKNIFYINDILLHQKNIIKKEEKEEILNNIMEKEYNYDPILNVCKLFFNRIQEENIYKKEKNFTTNNIDFKIKQEFIISKTDLPDVFILEQNKIDYGNPIIQTAKTSENVNLLFSNNKEGDDIKIWCEYLDNFKKWKPILKNGI